MVKIEGLKELEKALSELPKATGKRVTRKVLKDAGEPIAKTARAMAPKDEGHLAESIDVSTKLARSQRKGSGPTMTANGWRSESKNSVEMYVGPGQHPQAITQEFGTFKEPAQPFMRPAWDSQKMTALNIIKDTLGYHIAQAAKRLAGKGG